MGNQVLKILADENIPGLQRCFAPLGDVVTLAGRAISKADLQDVDVLLVRSVTIVNKQLLADTPVKFVGSATIGVDHVDTAYLQRANIHFAHAPGSNARSVVEYVLAALARTRPDFFANKSIRCAVVGYGNVGSRLAAAFVALGHEVYVCDPFIKPVPGFNWCNFTEALQCEVLSFHVPLTKSGTYRTYHALNADALRQRPAGGVIINSARGAVVDNAALKHALQNGLEQTLVLDVWENEPAIDRELLKLVSLATPHIAGYAADGKMRGSIMLRNALRRFLRLAEPDSVDKERFEAEAFAELPPVSIAIAKTDSVADVLLKAYAIDDDDRRLREVLSDQVTEKQGELSFDGQRKHYPLRREWARLNLSGGPGDLQTNTLLTALGFPLPDKKPG